MRISKESWSRYQRAHALLKDNAKAKLEKYFDSLPWGESESRSINLLCRYAAQLVRIYGAADGELAAQFYDELMAMQGATVKPAEIAEVDEDFVVRDVSAAVNEGTSSTAQKTLASAVVSGYVKRAGIETMRSAAIRDRAMWAWVCIGDTCAFCRVLGSNGWQEASRSIQAGNHAEHIHDSCDCQFVVKPPGAKLEVEGYDPDALYDEYKDASGYSPKDKINAIRRAGYTPEYAEQRNARRRELYAQQKQAEQAE